MPNHYHLLVRTPDANVSRAIQWLNGSYGMWYNRSHNRSGHLFGERFKAILLENGVRGLEVSVYVHMNRVATKEFGLGKKDKAVQSKGMGKPPAKQDVERRLENVRKFEWSSYRAYAGYEKMPEWLDGEGLLQRMGKGLDAQTKAYREMFEGRIRQGVEEDIWDKVRWGLVLGGERFARKVRGKIVVVQESSGRRELGRRRSFEEVVRMVERIKGEPWPAFRDRYGDWGRDLVLWAGRRFCGMRLSELSEKVGGIGNSAVTVAVGRLQQESLKQSSIRRAMQAMTRECEV
jgi:hypothetical protein